MTSKMRILSLLLPLLYPSCNALLQQQTNLVGVGFRRTNGIAAALKSTGKSFLSMKDGFGDDGNGSSNQQRFKELSPETSFGSEVVPEGQRPVNEYLEVTKQPFFDWASQESGNKGLLIRLGALYGAVFVAVCYPISGATFTQEGYLLQKLAASNVGALFLVFFLLLRLYSGWGYLAERLTSKVIEYEETGWYDGDFELKTDAEMKRDRFLYNDKVKPVVSRLKKFTLSAGGLALASCIALNVAVSDKPMFDEYDPDVLSRLQYDEKLAETAAVNSAGRPTYCDNRYYRAVAGGGQGCN